ncbi:DNA topoisomerase IB [Limimaricola hongkongensis]|uniref:DNA topoisomerase n=1 Tax=Limimaricola hongkongensis DSM 17492 TaxID=1122180 RepID=A0A017HG39_9RHOB|nr:DNA topoisomerase IB [Limimaricola hongkongensis]EYD73285.1 DNA topoisomerase IB (poxvirus type) [Limimaricola hongkongensis DSM 17492]
MPPPASLVYYPDSEPGITRRRRGRGFTYTAPDGTTIARGPERRRIEALAVPPAYEKVWICPAPHGHLQATGLDARTRKQYRYHPDWRAWREAHKFDHLAEFGAALPAIRRRIRRDLSGEAGELDFAIAAVLALIDRVSIRVGNPEYAAENRTYGATTLTGRHIRLTGDEMRLRYRAKGNKQVNRRLKDKSLMKVLGQLHDLPGKELIGWIDEDGTPRGVSSGQVNDRLAEITGSDHITAKTFRTWAGSEAALSCALREEELTIKSMSEAAAERLHNTPTIARNSYIHPRVIALHEADARDRAALLDDLPETAGLRQAERALLRLLS